MDEAFHLSETQFFQIHGIMDCTDSLKILVRWIRGEC